MLEAEFRFFLSHQEDLFRKYPNKHLLIRGNGIVGVYSDHMKAYRRGRDRYGLGQFLIQHCLPGELGRSQTFHSQVIL